MSSIFIEFSKISLMRHENIPTDFTVDHYICMPPVYNGAHLAVDVYTIGPPNNYLENNGETL